MLPGPARESRPSEIDHRRFDWEYKLHARQCGTENIRLINSGLVGGHSGIWERDYECDHCGATWTERESR